MTVTTVIQEISRLEDVYCEQCPIKQDLRSRRGKTAAHQFCIHTCSVGRELQEMGQNLLRESFFSK